MPTVGDVASLLSRAVTAIGGQERPGQLRMADAVDSALTEGRHLLVQAGTGTGKSIAYLVPALRYALIEQKPVVVATATLALQAQIADRDLPALIETLAPALPHRPTFAVVKGRRHYLCQRRLAGDGAVTSEDAAAPVLVDLTPTSKIGQEITRLQSWAKSTETGDRDELRPSVSERAWGQVSVSARECIGAARCSFGDTCFAEQARARAERSDIVITNHALLAIDAVEGIPVLPEHDAVVIDEAHELVDRVTAAAAEELHPVAIERAAARCRTLAKGAAAEVRLLGDAASALEEVLAGLPEQRVQPPPPVLAAALRLVVSSARTMQSVLQRDRTPDKDDGSGRMAWQLLDGLRRTAERCETSSDQDVVWITRDERTGSTLHVAPLSVGGLLGPGLFASRTVVLTSATLQIGGSFDPVAAGVGLSLSDREGWSDLDVGSPFDYRRQAMLYVAGHLPAPNRDPMPPVVQDELAELISAAGGRTLGLFSSRRAAELAAGAMRERCDTEILCQGDAPTAELVRRFAAEPTASLFGTLSLWQGVDVPGEALQLVVIDRIPFPRPDDPLMAARAAEVARRGGNGFLSITAAAAAVRLAQGAGRLIRSADDRGVVAVLDSRLSTARYAPYLLASLPAFWLTRDPEQVRRSLQALREPAWS